jgi:hypothetical protein
MLGALRDNVPHGLRWSQPSGGVQPLVPPRSRLAVKLAEVLATLIEERGELKPSESGVSRPIV